MKKIRTIACSSLLTLLLASSANVGVVHALVGPHTYVDATSGDVFLGGDYIELGISKSGSFGTHSGLSSLPTGFYGAGGNTDIGMSSNPAGFGVAPDLSMDFFMPGSPEERWIVGYKQSGTPTTASNAELRGTHGIPNNAITNLSSGNTLKAKGVGTLNSTLETTQLISFNRGDKFFKNEVTLKNVSGSAIDNVRFMRSFDPDNTVDQGGDFTTHNYIPYTQAAGDGKAVVVADTNTTGGSDPVYAQNGSYSPILFYSSDARARVSTFGFSNTNPYAAQAYDSALAKGTSVDADQAITITFDVGTLAPGDSQMVVYYTSLDNRDFSDVLADIQQRAAAADTDSDNVADSTEAGGPNSGDANGDGTADAQQSNVTALPNTAVGSGAYEALQVTGGCSTITQASVKTTADLGGDGSYQYPLGLTDYAVSCTTPGNTAHITVFYDKVYDTSKWTVRKFIHGAYTAVPGATFAKATVGSSQVTTLSYDVVDGGALDADGLANGTVVDPAGPAVLAATTTAATAPNTGLQPLSKAVMVAPLAVASGFIAYGITRRRAARI